MDVPQTEAGALWTPAVPPVALDWLPVGGLRLRFGHHRPEGAVRGTVLVLPGRAEFIEKYAETLTELQGWGFATAILDWRGQGGSQRLLPQRDRGYVLRVEDYLADLDAVVARLELLDADDLAATPGQMKQRGAAHGAEPDDGNIKLVQMSSPASCRFPRPSGRRIRTRKGSRRSIMPGRLRLPRGFS